MKEHTTDCRIHDDGSCCDCGALSSLKRPSFPTWVLVVAAIYPGAVLASAVSGGQGPSWESIGVGAISMVIMLVGAYAKGVSNRVDKLDEKYTQLNQNVLREYHTKQDLNEILGEIKSSVKALHQRFDKMESLYGR